MKEIKKNKIIEIIKEKEFITVDELSKILEVVPLTIRRYLKELELENKIIKLHGGAKIKEDNILVEKEYIIKSKINRKEKEYIAKISASLIEDEDIIYIGPGSTVELILQYIGNKNITLITNSLSIIKKYSHLDNINLIIIGGTVKKSTESILPDLFTKISDRININKAFIGTNGIYLNKITFSDKNVGIIEEEMIKNANQSYILADFTKFDKKSFYTLNTKNKISIITDNNINLNILKKYKKFFKIINK